MKARTEELLYLLLWSLDAVTRPTFRNLNASFEEWAYRKGFFRQIASLERRKFIERRSISKRDRVYRLSTVGRLHALGGRDPEERWNRKWDGRWRVILFDVPTSKNAQRERLRRYLRGRGFGYLQNSVWVTPDSVEEERAVLIGGKIDVESLIFLEARPCAGESNEEIVAGAWDFERINRGYSRYLKILDERVTGCLAAASAARELLNWGRKEREAWLGAVKHDPLLPEGLLPAGYLGRKAWQKRMKTLQRTAQQTRSFKQLKNHSTN